MAPAKVLEGPHDYAIAWIAALPKERAAATAMLDERHGEPPNFSQHPSDTNAYTWGRISNHNVAIASLAAGCLGTTSAATTASGILSSLPHIKFGLLVGIGAGVANNWQDVRLGDVVVSQPWGNNGGVVQHDFGRANPKGAWERSDFLSKPPEALLKALARLQSEHEIEPKRVPEFLQDAAARNPMFASNFMHPGSQHDRLFETDYDHHEGGTDTCADCDSSREVARRSRGSDEPQIHYGVIASGNTLVSDIRIRDRIIAEIDRNIICFEMEAAGLMNNFPCLVIRGVSDYADSHKNYQWHRYASATAAAFAKEFLTYIDVTDIRKTKEARDTLSKIADQMHRSREEQKVHSFLQALFTCPYAESKNRNKKRVEGTCEWFTSHRRFRHWQDSPQSALLWVSADPGCGKSVLARYLVDEVLPQSQRLVCYFFFKDDFQDQRSSTNALCALLRQLYEYDQDLLDESVLRKFAHDGEKFIRSFSDLWDTLKSVAAQQTSREILCVIDALDECQDIDQAPFIDAICGLHSGPTPSNKAKLKFLVTSRPYGNINQKFRKLELVSPTIHLEGEGDDEVKRITSEINLVVQHTALEIAGEKDLESEEYMLLVQQLTSVPNRTYLWVYLTLEFIRQTPGFTRGNVRRAVTTIPRSVDEAYEKILKRSPDPQKAHKILSILIVAMRPLSLREMSLAFAININYQTYEELEDELEPEERFHGTARDLCGLFVVIVDSKFYLLHQTARDFLVAQKSSTPSRQDVLQPPLAVRSLQWKHSIDLLRSHSLVTHLCLWYLRFCSVGKRQSLFLSYSSIHWPTHFRDGGPENDEEDTVAVARDLCTPNSRLYQVWYDIYAAAVPESPETSSPLILASYFGLEPVVRSLSGRRVELEVRDKRYGQTALSLAAREGHFSTANLLIHHGAKIDSKDDSISLTPLGYAIKYQSVYYSTRQQKEVAEMLLKRGADPNARSDTGQFVIDTCVNTDDVSMMRLLLDHGARIDTREESTMFGLDHFRGMTASINAWFYRSDESTVEDEDAGRSSILCSAVSRGNVPMARLLIEHGANIESVSDTAGSGTPLAIAAEKGDLAMIELLLQKGARIESSPDGSRTPLKTAIRSGQYEAMKLLLDRGAKFEPGLKDPSRNSLLHLAVDGGSKTVVEKVLSIGVDTNTSGYQRRTPLFTAIEGGDVGIIELLLDRGADPNWNDEEGKTPLELAGMQDDQQAMKLLIQRGGQLEKSVDTLGGFLLYRKWQAADFFLDQGFDINTKDEDGRSILSRYADSNSDVRHGEKTQILWILEKHAKVDSRDYYGRTPLWWAARSGSSYKVDLLLERHADIENIDIYEDTPLAWALKERERYYMAELLLAKGARLDCESVRRTRGPLLRAAELGNLRLIQEMVDAGEDIHSQDTSYGMTALGRAALNGHESAVELLLSMGAAVDHQGKDGRTPLSDAAEFSYHDVVRILLDNGADPNARDQRGRGPLSWATYSDLAPSPTETTIELLLQNNAKVAFEDDDGCKPICYVTGSGVNIRQQYTRLELLLESGAKGDCRNDCQRHFLYCNAKSEDGAAIARLFESADFFERPLDFATGDTARQEQNAKSRARAKSAKAAKKQRKEEAKERWRALDATARAEIAQRGKDRKAKEAGTHHIAQTETATSIALEASEGESEKGA